MTEKVPDTLSLNDIETIEELTSRWIFQAVYDFGMEAYEIFLNSPDSVEDIAEDISGNCLIGLRDSMCKRIYGTVDYKKARSVILPDQTVRQALFIDSKQKKKTALQRSRCHNCRCG